MDGVTDGALDTEIDEGALVRAVEGADVSECVLTELVESELGICFPSISPLSAFDLMRTSKHKIRQFFIIAVSGSTLNPNQ